ncbi:MAG: IS630 family transposase [Pseudonocardiaceae bacterium]
MADQIWAFQVSESDRVELERRVRSQTEPAGTAQRARIVLLSADGVMGRDIANMVGCSEQTVVAWRARYATEGLAGLDDRPRSGRPPTIDAAKRSQILATTLKPPPVELGVTHWSSRLLARQAGVDHSTVARIWQYYGIKPYRMETFKFSTDPELEAKVTDVVGLYMNPPDQAVVLSVDEKTQVQASDRTQPMLPVRPGLAARRTHDYVRNGTTTLFAALEVATGKVVDACYPRHRNQEFLKFLKQVAKAYPRVQLHIVCDNYATHKHENVRKWLAKNKRVTLHFTPTSASWMNLVEAFFSIITRQAIHRGSFPSVADLIAAIRRFIDGWNDRCEPFVWTKTADEILSHAKMIKKTSATNH